MHTHKHKHTHKQYAYARAYESPSQVIGCFGNDNALRPLADNINHENFLIAVAQHRPIIFDGTGKVDDRIHITS